MTSFSKYLLGKKLSELNQSQESIETLSLWILHHRKHAATIIEYWASEFIIVSEKQKIAFLFLGNEILKTSKKSHIFREELEKVLPDIFRHIGKNFSKCNLIEQTYRILDIWRNHGFFSENTIKDLRACLNKASLTSTIEEEYNELELEQPHDIKKMFLALNAPTPEELIEALESVNDLSLASIFTRNKINAFPKKLFDTKAIYALRNTMEAAKYNEELEKVGKLVDSYNELLEWELKQRKKFHDMLLGYKEAELEHITDIEKKLEDIKNSLKEKIHLREEMERHRESLPDLEHLSNTTELPPLPSVQDLFGKKQEAK